MRSLNVFVATAASFCMANVAIAKPTKLDMKKLEGIWKPTPQSAPNCEEFEVRHIADHDGWVDYYVATGRSETAGFYYFNNTHRKQYGRELTDWLINYFDGYTDVPRIPNAEAVKFVVWNRTEGFYADRYDITSVMLIDRNHIGVYHRSSSWRLGHGSKVHYDTETCILQKSK
jgi:hypothetical protein